MFLLLYLRKQSLIPHSFCSPELLAHILYEKYVMAVPLERQSKSFKAMGMRLSTATLSNWVIYAAENFMKPIYTEMKKQLLSCSVIHADETVVQVLKEPNRKAKTESRMWVYCAGKYEAHSNILFEYSITRSGDNAQRFLSGYKGYNKLTYVTRCGCWAHARRKFVEALPTDNALLATSSAVKGVEMCNDIFKLERVFEGLAADEKDGKTIEARRYTDEERYIARKERSRVLVESFFAWLETVPVSGKVKLSGRFSTASMRKNICPVSLRMGVFRWITTEPRMPSVPLSWDERIGSFPPLKKERMLPQ